MLKNHPGHEVEGKQKAKGQLFVGLTVLPTTKLNFVLKGCREGKGRFVVEKQSETLAKMQL